MNAMMGRNLDKITLLAYLIDDKKIARIYSGSKTRLLIMMSPRVLAQELTIAIISRKI